MINMMTWGNGPWIDEPNKVTWTDKKTGLRCLAKRNQTMGMWLGYVFVPEGHPAYGKHYDQIEADVHGGLTFAGDGGEEDGMPGCWMIGFDCGHAGGVVPAFRQIMPSMYGSEYRTIDYVTKECESLAKQLSKMV